MDIVQEAFTKLFPDKVLNYTSKIKYSGQFKGYNANVLLRSNHLQFKLSKNWRGVNRDIKIGLIQELLAKVMKQKPRKTLNQDLYNIFLKEVHIAVPKTRSHPILKDSFSKVNDKYFYNIIEQPNLVWIESTNRLGSYDYGADTISISKILEPHPELLDYVMYHEILHKKHKFKQSKTGNRSYHHTRAFRQDEKRFENADRLERQLSLVVSKAKLKNKILPKKTKKRIKKAKNFFLDLFGI